MTPKASQTYSKTCYCYLQINEEVGSKTIRRKQLSHLRLNVVWVVLLVCNIILTYHFDGIQSCVEEEGTCKTTNVVISKVEEEGKFFESLKNLCVLCFGLRSILLFFFSSSHIIVAKLFALTIPFWRLLW